MAEPSWEELRRWFPPDRGALVPPQTFEIALVLGGTVSAGAYTAGVLDFLIEALDAWSDQVLQAGEGHRVVLKIVTGASGGGLCGAVLAAACRHRFPPVRPDTQDRWHLNPLYRTWVQQIGIEKLLGAKDQRATGRPPSVLDSCPLDALADELMAFPDDPEPQTADRAWLEPDLHVAFTVTNLAGVPYGIDFSGPSGLGHMMRLHADIMEFAVPTRADMPADRARWPDNVVALGSDRAGRLVPGCGSTAFQTSALASGAFPLVLKARTLSKKGKAYFYRFADWGGPDGRTFRPSKPAIDPDHVLEYSAVDGGAMDNEPFELARRHLAGTAGRNPRGGSDANRAVILIDPLHLSPPYRAPDHRFLSYPGPLLRSFMGQVKFRPDEIALMQDTAVYSRWMIAPKRGQRVGDQAIATAGLGGFLGFFSEDYRHHDFLLGRRNAQQFLRAWFALPPDNPVFGTTSPHACVCPDHRPIVPLCGMAAEEVAQPDWPGETLPKGSARFRPAIARRAGAVYPFLRDEVVAGGPTSGGGLFAQLGRWLMRRVMDGLWLVLRGFLVNRLIAHLDGAIQRVRQEQGAADQTADTPRKSP